MCGVKERCLGCGGQEEEGIRGRLVTGVQTWARTIYIHGVEVNENGNVISHDIIAQCHSVFENVRIILEEAGSSWDKLVDVTVFLTDIKNDFDSYNKLYSEYFKENQPCRTTVEVSSLPTPIAIELRSEERRVGKERRSRWSPYH